MDNSRQWNRIIWNKWIEVDLDAVAHNTQKIKEFIGPDRELMAVVKADAYGLGAVEVSRLVLQNGAVALGVSNLQEALELRENGITAPILILAPLLPEESILAVDYNLTPSISADFQLEELIRAARSRGKVLPVHLEVETGMGRTGFSPSEAFAAGRKINDSQELSLEGLYTHFANAGGSPRYTRGQFETLLKVAGEFQNAGIQFGKLHACNSAAAVKYPEMHLDMVRVGTLIYGQLPAGVHSVPFSIQDPWSVKARVLYTRLLPAGSTVGYGREKKLKKDTRIAVVALGYADGFYVAPVARAGNWKMLLKSILKLLLDYLGIRPMVEGVRLKGTKVPVLGRVGMQFTALDISEVGGVEAGEEAEFPLRRVNANSRIPRLYLREGNVRKVVLARAALDHVSFENT